VSNNPLNLAFRFVLEIAALLALGYWGWTSGEGILRYVLALGVPIAAAALWGTFRVPGDSSSSGGVPVAVSGKVRLLVELAVFGSATLALRWAGLETLSVAFAAATILHYAISYDRVLWLLRER
jgi:hypothetical protein